MKTLARILIILFGVSLLMGCQTGYLIKSSYYQLKMLSKKETFDDAMKDSRLDAETKRKIRLVQDVKKFAEEKIGLVHTKNYQTFVLLDDKYVVYAVTAAYQDRLEGYTWWFPIVGQVPYKGFFKKADALDEQSDLEKKSLDVSVRGVSAYSTLGWFSDPLLSSMTSYDDSDLVETVIHETTHATLYIKSNADFNEQLAVFVGIKGMEQFYQSVEGPDSPTVKHARMISEDSKTFSNFIAKEIKRVEEFYKEHKGSPTLLQDRNKVFEQLKENFKTQCIPDLKTDYYKYFAQQKINNALLLSYKTYYQDLHLFESAFEKFDHSWPKFFEFFKSLKSSEEPDKELKKFLGVTADGSK